MLWLIIAAGIASLRAGTFLCVNQPCTTLKIQCEACSPRMEGLCFTCSFKILAPITPHQDSSLFKWQLHGVDLVKKKKRSLLNPGERKPWWRTTVMAECSVGNRWFTSGSFSLSFKKGKRNYETWTKIVLQVCFLIKYLDNKVICTWCGGCLVANPEPKSQAEYLPLFHPHIQSIIKFSPFQPKCVLECPYSTPST